MKRLLILDRTDLQSGCEKLPLNKININYISHIPYQLIQQYDMVLFFDTDNTVKVLKSRYAMDYTIY